MVGGAKRLGQDNGGFALPRLVVRSRWCTVVGGMLASGATAVKGSVSEAVEQGSSIYIYYYLFFFCFGWLLV